MDKIDLSAQLRTADITPSAIRSQGMIPAVVYGKGEEPMPVVVTWNDFQKAYKLAGETTIINLQIPESAPKMVLIKDVQLSPDKDDYLNIDFYRIKAGEKLRVAVPLRFEGESPAIKDFGGILVTNKNDIEVECLPQDLPHEFVVDLTVLKNIDDAIAVKDIKVGAGVEVLDNLEDSIVVVTPPAAEEVEPVVSEAEAVASVEATEEKIEPGEVGTETEAEK